MPAHFIYWGDSRKERKWRQRPRMFQKNKATRHTVLYPAWRFGSPNHFGGWKGKNYFSKASSANLKNSENVIPRFSASAFARSIKSSGKLAATVLHLVVPMRGRPLPFLFPPQSSFWALGIMHHPLCFLYSSKGS